eukprot:m.195597 g.195597  ORF g.195597 m.195597 type:complete len:483 (+) comp32574_c3_seq5:118-1566(+)
MAEQQRIFDEQIASGMSEVYAQAFASKYIQGAVFARHFATLREKRYHSKLAAAATVAGLDSAPQDVKILEKAHIMKEKKEKYVMIEREVFGALFFSAFITKLFYTFQDAKKLYFVMEFAQNGELLGWIKKLGSFDEECTRFYSAEILMALDHMHSKNIIHRDLKPENILLSEKMHVKICDFGTAKIMSDEDEEGANSFVGTAQYVSPELLNDKKSCKGSDIWGLGCIMYQLLSGDFPFRAGNEYQTFKKISALDYEIPPGFPQLGKELVEKILVLDPDDRAGSQKHGGIASLKQNPFWKDLPCDWEQLHLHEPPELDDFLPANATDDIALHGRDNVDVDIDDLLAAAYKGTTPTGSLSIEKRKREEKDAMLKVQADKSPWHGFCNPNELILKTGLVDKRKGLFSKRRQLVMTDTPRLFYIDPVSLAVMGEIPWSSELKPLYRSPKTFFIHTPDRTYYLDDAEKAAITWVDAIQRLLKMNVSE